MLVKGTVLSRFIYILILTIPAYTQAQEVVDSTFLDKSHEATSRELATVIKVVLYPDISLDSSAEEKVYKEGKLSLVYHYKNYSKNIYDGVQERYFPSGEKKALETYIEGSLDGLVETYYESGQIKRRDTFASGALVAGHVYDPRGDIMPYFPYLVESSYPGGMDSLLTEIQRLFVYPRRMLRKRKEGRTYLKYTVSKEGILENLEVHKSSGERELDEAAVAAVQGLKHRFNPAKRDGENIASYYLLPILMELTDPQ